MILTPDNEYAVVLDACVLAPMPLCDTLLRLAEEPAMYRIIWSKTLLSEVDRTLQRFGYSEEQRVRRIRSMEACFPEAMVALPDFLVESIPSLPDKDDRHIVAAAIRGGANAIVTLNTTHFPSECVSQLDLLVQTPDDFLLHQFHLNPSLIIEKIDAQASAISQQREEVISLLANTVPKFSALLQDRNR